MSMMISSSKSRKKEQYEWEATREDVPRLVAIEAEPITSTARLTTTVGALRLAMTTTFVS